MGTVHWSAEKTETLLGFLGAGLRPVEIARRMGLSYPAVYNQCIKHQTKAYLKGNEKIAMDRVRSCLKCKVDFKSSGPGNRVCGPCKKLNDGVSGSFNVVYF